jgi:hypothetical protein
VDLFKNEISRATNSKYEDGSFVKTESYEKRDHLYLQQEHFYKSILDKTTPVVTYDDGANAVYYVSKVLESLEVDGIISL